MEILMAEPIEKEAKPEVKKAAPKAISVGDVMGGAKPKSKTAPKTQAKSKHRHTHIEHHDDGSHTVRHSGAGDEVSYAAPDLNGVKAGLDANIGGGQDPNAGAPPVDPMAAGGAPPAGPSVGAPPPAAAAPPMATA
jgi:hypothetical protein